MGLEYIWILPRVGPLCRYFTPRYRLWSNIWHKGSTRGEISIYSSPHELFLKHRPTKMTQFLITSAGTTFLRHNRGHDLCAF